MLSSDTIGLLGERGFVGSRVKRKLHSMKACLKEATPVLLSTAPVWVTAEKIEMYRQHGLRRLVCLSSSALIGWQKSENSYEKETRTKIQRAEDFIMEQCAAHRIPVTIFRPTLIYGHGMDKNISRIAGFIERFSFFPVYGSAAGLRRPLHVDDLAELMVRAIDTSKSFNTIYTVQGGEEIAYSSIVRRIFEWKKKKARIVSLPALPLLLDVYGTLTRNKAINGEVAKRMVQDMVYDTSQVEGDFSFHPRKFTSLV